MSQRRYCADGADQWAGWSYYGAAHRYDVHGTPEAASACARAMDQLEAAADEARLRELAFADGDRCAFVRLIEIMVDGDRLDDLRVLARDGDGRAFTTLMELLFRTDRVEQLRAEVDEFAGARFWLAQLHIRRGEVDAGLAELAVAELDPDHGRSAHSERIAQLLRFDRVAEVRAMVEAGDRAAARRLRRAEQERDRSQ